MPDRDDDSASMIRLLKARRFLPLFLTQFLGAFNDNLFKNALIILVVFGDSVDSPFNHASLAALAAGLFILPYVLFSATAGQLADRYNKARLCQYTKWAELFIMLLATVALNSGNLWLLLLLLFLIGTQAAFFSPMKYSLLPEQLYPHEVLTGNALVECATFLAILGGTIAGAMLINDPNGVMVVSTVLVSISIFGIITSHVIPNSAPKAPELRMNWALHWETLSVIITAWQQPALRLCILGCSWFWMLGTVFLTYFPSLTKDVIGGNEEVATSMLVAFSVGIGIGSLLCQRLLRETICLRYVIWAMLAISFFTADLYAVLSFATVAEDVGAATFLSTLPNIRLMVDLLMIAIAGGFYIVPLYALLQTTALEDIRARMVAANNIVNALFMVAGALLCMLLSSLAISIPEILMLFGVLNLGVTLWMYRQTAPHVQKTG